MCTCVCVHVCVYDAIQSGYINPSPWPVAIVAAIMVINESQRLNLHESRDKITLYFQVSSWCVAVGFYVLYENEG